MRFLLILSFLFTACGKEEAVKADNKDSKYGGYIYLSTSSDPKSFNPILAQETSTTAVTGLIFEGLTRVNVHTLDVEPNLALFWDIKKGGREWIFYLRKDVCWNDGEPFMADDVVFTFNELIYNPDIPSSSSDVLKVKGEPFKVEKIDNYTVKFSLAATYAPFLMAMGHEILPKHKLEGIVKKGSFNTTWTLDTQPSEIVGTGPFMLKKYRPGQFIELTKNPYYWKMSQEDTLPYLDGVRFLVVQNIDTALLKFLDTELDYYSLRGEDFAILNPEQEDGNFKIYQVGPTFGSRFLVFNQNPDINPKTKAPFVDKRKIVWFKDKRFRQAISHAIDREAMIEIVLNGFGYTQYGPLSSSSGYFYNPGVAKYEYDLDKANQLLKELGLVDIDNDGILEDADGVDVEFTLFTNAENTDRVKIAEIIKKDLSEIGIKVHFLPLEFNNIVSKIISTYDWEAIILGFTGGIEPHFSSNIWLSTGHLHAWYPRQEQPSTDWEREIDDIFTKAVQVLNRSQRKKMYDKWQEIASHEVPLIYTVLSENMFALRNRFGNLDLTPYGGVFHNIEEIYVLK
ncbi:MAG: ABC transporter substrate-binding protein [Candidatus Saelkia tenebricola]|nr:ABC transporter substrate-binding protein [Candidatus Saelkia tenebricola]